MQDTNGLQTNVDNASKLQQAINDDLFPKVAHISDIKQVIEEMQGLAQNIREPQMKALILLQKLGENKYLHPNGSPYKELYKYILEKGKVHVADPNFFLDTIEALIPKPPKPILLAEKGMKK
ncbi:hypothetical protein [Cytobacillus gottheilii]|uniref:hypothetical protein n=1 Tax=Cytobacillus gottheilii TaxID=859144 RepID=UPI002493E919|nr:hypothetical protein [Cytobacillus gottheilii]